MKKHIFFTAVCGLSWCGPTSAQDDLPEKAHLDKILERRTFTPEEEAALNQDADPAIDVRDLVIYLNGLPISASFGSAESLAFHSQGSVSLPVYFSKPVTGTVTFDFGGTAQQGAGKDFTITPMSVNLTNETSTQVSIVFEPWQGIGGEKVVRLSVTRDPAVVPANGTYPSHLLRIRQFDAGEFTGILSFPPASGLPALSVRVGLDSSGNAVCAFPDGSNLLGPSLNLGWSPGFEGFPSFPESTAITIGKESLKRTVDLAATLQFQRMAEPYSDTVDAFLEAFPTGERPAMYHATLRFADLFAAGASDDDLAITYDGELAIQPVNYEESP